MNSARTTSESWKRCWVLLFLACLLVTGSAAAGAKDSSSQKGTQAPVKDKKSAEDIMFGNQQNKPAGMVDDLLTIPDRDATKSPATATENHLANSGASRGQNKTVKPNEIENSDQSKVGHPSAGAGKAESKEDQQNSLDGQKFDYYDYLQESDDSRLPYPSVEGYHLESIEEQKSALPDGNAPDDQTYNQRGEQTTGGADYPEDDYDGVLYRRKRTPKRAAISGGSFRKRSIHSNLDDLLGGNRRRSLRLKKREAGVEQFLAWLGMLRGGQEQARLRDESLRELELVDDEEPADLAESYFYEKPTGEWYNVGDESDESALFPPGLLDGALSPAATRDMMDEEVQLPSLVVPDWSNNRAPAVPAPSLPYPILTRRSQSSVNLPAAKSPFYPVDYRYVLMPGQKKKKRDSHHRRMGGINIQDLHEADPGKWGQFPTHRSRTDDSPDPDRLYALASLLAEETPEPEASNTEELDRRRRRAPKE